MNHSHETQNTDAIQNPDLRFQKVLACLDAMHIFEHPVKRDPRFFR